MASSEYIKEGESLIGSIESTNGAVSLPIIQVVNFACLSPELVSVSLKVLKVLDPRELGVGPILRVIDSRID